jgi:hypothetical protein
MFKAGDKARKANAMRGAFIAAGLSLAIPSTVWAIDAAGQNDGAIAGGAFIPFTPAKLDQSVLREVAASLGTEALRFTPAARPSKQERTVTMAVRVNDETARAISVRNAVKLARTPAGRGTSIAAQIGTIGGETIEPTRYDLGIAKGYQGFAAPAPKAVALPSGIRDIAMADLGEFDADSSDDNIKTSRFQPRISLEKEARTGRAPRTAAGADVRSLDVSGSYRVVGNLNVTAGVRLSQERDRIAPLTDGVEDSQAVYVGTQFKF